MKFVNRRFEQLSPDELYDLLALRSEVFVVEQDCVYQDIDGKDRKALHVLGYIDNKLVAYARCFDAGDYFNERAIGRVVVKMTYRKHDYGHQLMDAALKATFDRWGEGPVHISAQTYLIDFYKKHGFEPYGESYLEDGIPHMAMIKR